MRTKGLFLFKLKMDKKGEISKPKRLGVDDILEDISSIPPDQNDILFDKSSLDLGEDRLNKEQKQVYDRVERYVLFNSKIELENSSNLNSSIDKFDKDLDDIEKKLELFENFIDVSEKFLSLKKPN